MVQRLCSGCVAISRAWGLGFWIWLLADSAYSLSSHLGSLFEKERPLTTGHYIGLVLCLLCFLPVFRAMVRWSAVLVLRAFELHGDRPIVHHFLAPLFVAGFYKAAKIRMAKAYGLVVFVAIIGVVVANMPWPWRQIVDLGVVLNLSVGTIALFVLGVRVLVFRQFPVWALLGLDWQVYESGVESRSVAWEVAVGSEHRQEGLV